MPVKKHTAVPWSVMPSQADGANSKRIFANGKYIATVGGSDQEWPEVVALATLVAASPELLASLVDCLKIVRARNDLNPDIYEIIIIKRAEAAIAKATGQ